MKVATALTDLARIVRNAQRDRELNTVRSAVVAAQQRFSRNNTVQAGVRALRPTPTLPALAASLDRRDSACREQMRHRIILVLRTLSLSGSSIDGRAGLESLSTLELVNRFAAVLTRPDAATVWLALAVLTAELPDSATTTRVTRTAQHDGIAVAFADALWPTQSRRHQWAGVRVVSGEVLIDLHHTAQTKLATGIQRVARQSAQRWYRDHQPTLVGWTDDYLAMRELTAGERHNALTGVAGELTTTNEVLVPWHCTYVIPELATEQGRLARMQAMLQFSGSASGAIGFDCVPISTAETSVPAMGGAFANTMAALSHGDRIATISHSAGVEYRGWRAMLAGTGRTGPAIATISLPVESSKPSPRAREQASRRLLTGKLPMVLCVGSHEPRKNHSAVLHAANLLWREGLQFSLVFVGGNSWNSEGFTTQLRTLQDESRPVESVRALADDLLWAAYEIAYCTIFPSLNEGFGLPVAESLAAGTPVLTSNFGSMREIASEGGAVMVNPRDDHEIRDGLRRMLTDTDSYLQLRAQAARRSVRTWEHYAAQTWDYLVDGTLAQDSSA